jgi:hypothetical protein
VIALSFPSHRSSSLSAFALLALAIAACGGRTSGVGGSGSNVAASTGGSAGTVSGGSGTVSVVKSGTTSGAIASGSVAGGSGTATSGTVVSGSGSVTSGTVISSGTVGIPPPTADAGPDSAAMLGPVPSPGCGKALAVATGMWVPQPTGCPSPRLTGGYTVSNNNQGTAACEAIPPGSTVPATATLGSPEYRGWWLYVPTGYDATKPYTVIYNGAGCDDANWFNAGEDGYPYNTVDNGQAILVGLDYDTFANDPGCYDTRNLTSNDYVFFPWLLDQIESEFCVDTSKEFMSGYGSGASLTEQIACAFGDRLRGQVGVAAGESDVGPVVLPTCTAHPVASMFVHDFNDTDETYANALPACTSALKQNGCTTQVCNPLDATTTTPYLVPPGVNAAKHGAKCVSFNGCPAEYPVVFCVTYNNDASDGQDWGTPTLFWNFISTMPPASSGTMPLLPCPTPTFAPAAGAVPAGTNVVISTAGLPAGGEILFTTDGTVPTSNSQPYHAGAVGIQVTTAETFHAISTTMGATCTDSAVASATYTIAP